MKSTAYQYFSFRYSFPNECIATMHANELINRKARYKTLHNTKIKTSVKYKNKRNRLGSILKEVNHNGCSLFLAVESGSGVNGNNIHIVINPRVKLQAKKWI